MRQVTLLGYYGCGNMGDEALLAGVLHGMRSVAPKVEPVVLSADPPATMALHQVAAVDRMRPGSVWRAVSTSEALICGGGSLLQDITSARSLYYYLGILALARSRGLPICLFGQGIGPLTAPSARNFTRLALQRCAGIWTRDQESYHEVLRIGVRPAAMAAGEPGPLLKVTGDPAFLLPAVTAPEPVAEGSGPLWVVAARPWHGQAEWQPQLAAAIIAAAKPVGAVLKYLAMQPKLDEPLALELARATTAAGVAAEVVVPANFQQAQAVLAAARLVVAMRLHALVLAAIGGVASVALNYDPKVQAFAAEWELPCMAMGELAAADAAGRLAAMISAGQQEAHLLGARLGRRAAEMRLQVMRDLAEALVVAGLPVEELP